MEELRGGISHAKTPTQFIHLAIFSHHLRPETTEHSNPKS